MSDASQGPGWWLASDGKWYAPETAAGAASEAIKADQVARAQEGIDLVADLTRTEPPADSPTNPAPVARALTPDEQEDAEEEAERQRRSERAAAETAASWKAEDERQAAEEAKDTKLISGCTPAIIMALVLAIVAAGAVLVVKKNNDKDSSNTAATKCSSLRRRQDGLRLIACEHVESDSASTSDSDEPVVAGAGGSSPSSDASSSETSSEAAPGDGPFAATYTGTFTGTNPPDQFCPAGESIPATMTVTGQSGSNGISLTLDARSKDGSITFNDAQGTVGSDGSFQGTSAEGVALSAHFTVDGTGNAVAIDNGVVAHPECNGTFEGTRSG